MALRLCNWAPARAKFKLRSPLRGRPFHAVYRPNKLWVVFLVISATFLFLMRLFGLFLRFATIALNVMILLWA